MRLSIITINLNNAVGLKKTIESILSQTYRNIEYIIIDGVSNDGSVEIIKEFEANIITLGERSSNIKLRWLSEPDTGIYNAMNKGIQLATGDYLQFINSGDLLVQSDVIERMISWLNAQDFLPEILYGNMLKQFSTGKILRDKNAQGKELTFLNFFTGTINHSSAFIKKKLFDTYGLYDESLKIVSDWKFYLQVIAIGDEPVAYTDVDVTVFDMGGVSNINQTLEREERQKVLKELIPANILKDYEKHWFEIRQIERIKRYWLANKIFWLFERLLFKYERSNKSLYN